MFGSTQGMLCGAIPDHSIGNGVCLDLRILNNLVMSSPQGMAFYDVNTEDPTDNSKTTKEQKH